MSRPVVIAALTLFCVATFAADAAAQGPQFVTIGTSGAGGTYGIIGAAMAKVVNKHGGTTRMTVEATPGGGLGNVRLLGRERLDFGIATVDNAIAAYEGKGPFEKEQRKNIRVMLFGTDLPLHVVVPATSPVKSIADLRGKTVVTTSAANAAIYVPQTFAAYGLKKDTDYKLINVATTEAIEAFKDGRVDALATYVFVPVAPLLDLTTTRSVRFIGVEPDKRKLLTQTYGYYSSGKIAAKTYTGQGSDVESSTISGVLLTHEKISADLAYRVTKALLEHGDELKEVYNAAATFSPERQAARIAEGAVVPPWHPGTERYLRERGLLK
jgi:TRAP transporter TAXI family solute receptor